MKITDQNKKKIGLILLIAGILVMLGLCAVIGAPLTKYLGEPERFRELVTQYGFWAYLFYLFAVIFQVIFAFIPGEPFELVAGYAFGAVGGTLICLAGSTIGSAIVFLLTRRFGVKFVELFFSMDKIRSLKFLNNKKKMYVITFLLFFIPGTPKDLLSYVAGLTPIKVLPYLLITTVARIPSIVTSTISGDSVGLQNYQLALIVFSATAVVSIAGLLLYKFIVEKKNRETDAPDFEE